MIEIENLDRLREELGRAREDVLVMLTQPSWCVPCRRLRPHVETLNKRGLSVMYVDLDTVPDAVDEYGIRGVPKLFFYPEGWDEERRFVELHGRTVVQIQKEIEGIRNVG